MSDESRLYAEVYTSGDKLYLPLEEIEHRLKLGQIGLNAHIDCPSLTGDSPKPIWMIERLARCADTPEARMMEHLRSGLTPAVALIGLLIILVSGFIQQRGWLSVVDTGVGWAPMTLHDRWWTPWTYWLSHLDWMHWVGNGVLYYFCAQRVERIVGSFSLLLHLSMVLLGSAVAIWWLESGTVIGASTLVFGLWAMQVGWGFRLAHSLPPQVQAHYGWGNFLVFVPALVLNVLSAEVSHVAHWAAMAIGGALSSWSQPLTSQSRLDRKPVVLFGQIAGWHLLMLGVFFYCTQVPLSYSTRHDSDAGFGLPVPDHFTSSSVCGYPAWSSEGMTVYSTGRWLDSNIDSKPSMITERWYDCSPDVEIEQLTCTQIGKQAVVSHSNIEFYPETDWTVISCEGDVALLEHVIQRGELLLRAGCMYETAQTRVLCEEWLSKVTLGETRQENANFKTWKQNDQRGDRTLEYVSQLIQVGRIQEADDLLREVEARFDAYKWRGTETRLKLHRYYPYQWTLEKEWLERVSTSIPIDEITVLRLVVELSIERGWCDISEASWTRWRRLMPTGLDEIGGLVNQCDGD